MSGGVVCYIERDLGGAVIKRARLVAAGLSRAWSAPEAQTVSTAAQPIDGPGAALSTTKLAARWISETIESVGLKRIAWVCVDPEGSVCAWLSAPSPEQTVIEASIMQAAQDAGAGDAAGLGAGRLLAMASPSGAAGLTVVPDTSVQALATLEETPEGASPKKALLPSKRPAPSKNSTARKHRYAVLAVPDAPVRVLLDELDQLGIEVEGVCSFWHAMARAWDAPIAAAGPTTSLDAAASSSATVLVDPAGRLIWAWSAGGELVAGGSMRLSALARAVEPPQEPLSDTSTRRIAADAIAPPTLEFTAAEVGRLVMDWLAWSVQLGHCPRRVICLATPTLSDGAVDGAGALGRALARAWPGATVDAGTYDDPVGATVARLAGLGTDSSVPVAPAASARDISARSALMPLSSRAGRADRAKFRWAAAGVLMGAVAIGALGWQLGQAGDEARRAADVATAQRLELLTALEPTIPGIAKDPKAKDALETRVQQLREQAAKIRPPRPVIAETVRLMKALEGHPEVRLLEFDCNAMFNAKAALAVPAATTGPTILETLRSIPGVLPWTGTVPALYSSSSQRQYILTGLWPIEDPRAQGGQR